MSDPTNTDAATVDTDAQTVADGAGAAEYPDEAARATAVTGEPVVTVNGRARRLGATSGMSAFRGLAAKRAERGQQSADDGFDPSEHSVAEVKAYLADHEDQSTYILDRERAGKARVSLIGA